MPPRKPRPDSIQALTIKRIPMKDAGVVRYRVYSDPQNYVAVIAENALMAMETAGITEPYKLVRDLIFEDNMKSEKLDVEKTEQIPLRTEKLKPLAKKLKEMPKPRSKTGFVALSLGDLKITEVAESVLDAKTMRAQLDIASASSEVSLPEPSQAVEGAEELPSSTFEEDEKPGEAVIEPPAAGGETPETSEPLVISVDPDELLEKKEETLSAKQVIDLLKDSGEES